MPKATFEYNLPEEQFEMEHHIKGPEYSLAIEGFRGYLRDLRKHGTEKQISIELIEHTFFEYFEGLLDQ